MGKILSIFRKNPSSEEQLTKLEEQIKDLEGYTLSTRETQRKFAGRFLVASIGTYVIAFAVFYFYFFPPTWRDRIIYSLPLLLFPVLIILLKYCVSWYFNSKIDRNNRRLIQLRNEKKKVLQNVMDKETYKVAVDLINAFGDRSMKMKAGTIDLDSSSGSQLNTSMAPSQLRTPVRPVNTQSNRGPVNTPSAPPVPYNRGTPAPIGFRTGAAPTPVVRNNGPAIAGSVPPLQFNTPKTPFPVIDTRKQNVMEKMMDFIISDGPSNRFAMICSSCCGHNGMALQEEFEYVAFKCAFCGVLNPARKIRPKARGLSPERRPQLMLQNKDSPSSSSSEDDEEGEQKDWAAVGKNTPLLVKREVGSRPEDSDGSDDGEVVKREENNNKAPADTAETTTTEPKDLDEKKRD